MPEDLIMLRKLWLSSLILALTGTTICLGFSENTSVIEKPKDRILTVTEDGKPARKCKLILAWTSKIGEKCYLVEALDNKAKITIVQKDFQTKDTKFDQNKSLTTNYHWRESDKSPSGAPLPPEVQLSEVQLSNISPVKKLEAQTAVNKSASIPMQTAIQKDVKPLKIEIATIKEEKDLRSVQTTPSEFITIPAPGSDKTVVLPEKNKILFGLKKTNQESEKVVILKQEKSLLNTTEGPEKIISIAEMPKLKAVEKPIPSAKTLIPSPKIAITPVPVTTRVQDVVKALPAKSEIEPAKIQDWRKSWGQVDNSSTTQKTTSQKSEEIELPHADKSKPDPFKDLDIVTPKLEQKIAKKAEKSIGKEAAKIEIESYTPGINKPKSNAELAFNTAPKTLSIESVKPVTKTKPIAEVSTLTKTTTKATIKAESKPNTQITNKNETVIIIEKPELKPSKKILVRKNEIEMTEKPDKAIVSEKAVGRIFGLLAKSPTTADKATTESIQPGNGSVIAAGATPINTIPFIPNGRPMGPIPTAHLITPPQAPQLYPNNQFMGNVIAKSPTQGMSNAFTNVQNQRPVPADFESTVVMQNAFNPPIPSEGATQKIEPSQMQATNRLEINQGFVNGGQPQMFYGQPIYAAPTTEVVLLENAQMLKTALQPSQREFAAGELSKYRGNSMVIAIIALTTAIKEDPAPLVRAACIRSLTRMKINSIEVLEVISEKKADLDPRVRIEAEEAMIQLTSGRNELSNKVRQAGSNPR